MTHLSALASIFIRKGVAIALLLFCTLAFGISPDDELDSVLLHIYDQMVSPSESSKLVAETYTATLSLKHASDKYLIFFDAYIRVNDSEKYQIAKWLFDPSVVASVVGKEGIECTVRFVVKEVRTENVYSKMPHIVAEILSIDA